VRVRCAVSEGGGSFAHAHASVLSSGVSVMRISASSRQFSQGWSCTHASLRHHLGYD
jgi:hypothetical protein